MVHAPEFHDDFANMLDHWVKYGGKQEMRLLLNRPQIERLVTLLRNGCTAPPS